jgi:hypothetical protein
MTSSKSKKARRKKRMERKKKRYAGFEQKLLQKFPDLPQNSIVIEPSGEARMSDVLTRFVAEEAESADSKESYEGLLTFAVLAWNASFLPKLRQKMMIGHALRAGFPPGRREVKTELRRFIEKLIARKHEHFSDYARWIVSFELVDLEDGGFYLNVASTLEPQ